MSWRSVNDPVKLFLDFRALWSGRVLQNDALRITVWRTVARIDKSGLFRYYSR
jgi:hypothetical protein